MILWGRCAVMQHCVCGSVLPREGGEGVPRPTRGASGLPVTFGCAAPITTSNCPQPHSQPPPATSASAPPLGHFALKPSLCGTMCRDTDVSAISAEPGPARTGARHQPIRCRRVSRREGRMDCDGQRATGSIGRRHSGSCLCGALPRCAGVKGGRRLRILFPIGYRSKWHATLAPEAHFC